MNDLAPHEIPCEIDIAAQWWQERITKSVDSELDKDKSDLFKKILVELLYHKYHNHWDVRQPLLGSGYRYVSLILLTCLYNPQTPFKGLCTLFLYTFLEYSRLTPPLSRSILFDETHFDDVLREAARRSDIPQFERRFPAESVVMWVDPGSVILKFLSSNKMKTLYTADDAMTRRH